MKQLIAKLWRHWTQGVDIPSAMQCIDMGIGYEMCNHDPVIQPNECGVKLLAYWQEYALAPFWMIRQHFCKHPHWVDESYGGPDSGYDAGYCPDCHLSFHHTMY